MVWGDFFILYILTDNIWRIMEISVSDVVMNERTGMALHMIIGAAGTGKSEYVGKIAVEYGETDLKNKCFLIVPDQFTMQTQVNMVKNSKNGGIMNIDVLSFSRLAHRVFEETNTGKTQVLDDMGKSLVLRKVAQNVKEQIPYLSGNLDKTGFIHEIKSAISEFMQYGLEPEDLQQLITYSEKKGLLKSKLTDLSIIYKEFLAYLGDNYITSEESMDILAQALDKSTLMTDSVCIFDGFTGFTPVQMRVLAKLFKKCKDVYITLCLDADTDPYTAKEQDLFKFTSKSYCNIAKLAKDTGIDVAKDVVMRDNYRFAEQPDLASMERHILRYDRYFYDEEPNNIHLYAAEDMDDEVRRLCANIRLLIKEGKAQYRDIAVITGDLQGYEYRLIREMNSFDIPVFWDKSKGIVFNPFVEYTMSLLKIIEKDYDSESVIRFLRSGMCVIARDDVDIFENYIVAKGIRYKKRYESLFISDDEEESAVINQVREYVNASVAFFYDKGVTKNEKTAAKDLVMSLYEFYVADGCAKKLESYAEIFENNGDYSLKQEYSQVYKETMKCLEQIHGLLGDEMLSIEEFGDLIETGFGEIRIGSIPQSVDRIVIGDIERSRLKSVKYLFFLGLNEGNIPKKSSNPGIISDSEREFLSAGDFELAPTPREKMYIERFYLYSNLTKPSKGLYLSYSAMDSEGNALLPAYLVGAFCGLYPKLKTAIGSSDAYPDTLDGLKAYVSDGIRKYMQGETDDKDKENLFTAIDGLTRLGSREIVDMCLSNSLFAYRGTRIEEQIAGLLYGVNMLGSISRMEKFAQCAYAYFLRYGLSLKERDEYVFENRDMGNIFHDCLKSFGEILKEEGVEWYDVTPQRAHELIDAALEKGAIRNESKLFETNTNKYIYNRMKHVMYKAFDVLAYQLKKGKYSIDEFEVEFDKETDINAINKAFEAPEKMRLKGRIDRMDVCNRDDKIFVKVIDYKTGDKDFKLLNFYKGLQLQLVVYMDKAMERVKNKNADKEVVPAAMLYYRLNESIVDVDESADEETINDKIRSSLCTKGLVNSDMEILSSLTDVSDGKKDVIPVSFKKDGSINHKSSKVADTDRFKLLSEYATYKLQDIGKKIISGEADKNPLSGKVDDSCKYCEFANVCGFEERLQGYSKEEVAEIGEDELYLNIEKELRGEGDGRG